MPIKKMSSTGLRILHLFHIAICAIGFGALTTMLVLLVGQSEFLIPDCSSIICFIDLMIYQNALRLLLLTGFIYGVFTKWGFVKQSWLLIKWGIAIGLMLMCTLTGISIITGIIELALFCLLYVLSVYKPFRKRASSARLRAN